MKAAMMIDTTDSNDIQQELVVYYARAEAQEKAK